MARTDAGFPGVVMAAALLLPIGLTNVAASPAAASAAGVTAATTPTEVTALSAEAAGGVLQVSGKAVFGGQEPVIVGQDPTGDAPGPLGTQMGLDVTEIAVHQPDPNNAAIDLVIRVSQLDSAPPPEVIRYLWQLTVNGQEYWVQAKTSDIASGTNLLDDPQGAVQHIPGSFRLRGNCGPIADTTVSTCGHVSWLDGVFDLDADEIRITIPLGSADAPEFTPGATIAGAPGVSASIQVAASNDATSDTAVQELDYLIPGKEVLLGIAPAGTDPAAVAFDTPATVTDDGSFTGELAATELEPGGEVFAKACFAENCGVRSAPITVAVAPHWATSAEASTEYGAVGWGAVQATGAPDTYPTCGDRSTAWAPQTAGEDPEWLKVTYDPPVEQAARVDIYETNKDGFVTGVELTRNDGSTETIFTGPDPTTCAGILSIPIAPGLPVVSVTIHTQAAGWEEIDAVGIAASA